MPCCAAASGKGGGFCGFWSQREEKIKQKLQSVFTEAKDKLRKLNEENHRYKRKLAEMEEAMVQQERKEQEMAVQYSHRSG